MTVEADVYNLLKGFVGNRVFPDVAPLNTTRPYITYQQVGGESIHYLGLEIPSKKNGRFQINCWADTRLAASALSLQVEGAFLTTSVVQATPLGSPSSDYEPDLLLFGTRQDFSVWSNR